MPLVGLQLAHTWFSFSRSHTCSPPAQCHCIVLSARYMPCLTVAHLDRFSNICCSSQLGQWYSMDTCGQCVKCSVCVSNLTMCHVLQPALLMCCYLQAMDRPFPQKHSSKQPRLDGQLAIALTLH